MSVDYSIWNCCYARGSLPADFMGGALVNSNQGMVEIPMTYSVVASAPRAAKRRLIGVDTGFKGGHSMTGRTFQSIESLQTVFAKLGYVVADVDAVVLTHLHFDHAGNFDAFPNAEIFVQRYEFESWTSVIASLDDTNAGKSSWKLSSMDVALLERFEVAVNRGRITLLDGDAEIAPGVFCRLARDTHTFGSQWLQVQTPAGPYVVAGDCVYWYVNVERMWPPGYLQGNAWNLMRTLERLRDLVGEDHLERIVPGHDMTVYSRHPSWVNGANPVAEVHLAGGEHSRIPVSAPAMTSGA